MRDNIADVQCNHLRVSECYVSMFVGHTGESCTILQTAEPIERRSGHRLLCTTPKPSDGCTYKRHLANTAEQSLLDSDVACRYHFSSNRYHFPTRSCV